MHQIMGKNGEKYALAQIPTVETAFVSGSEREVMELCFWQGEYSMDELLGQLQNKGFTTEMQLIDAEGKKYLYTDYCVFVSASVENVVTERETPDTPAKSNTMIKIRMGRMTYIEKQMAALGLL